MKNFNYITLLIAFFMMNIMYAELKTFGIPTDVETEETPSEETPAEEAPSEETPAEEVPSEETPSEETPEEDVPLEDMEEEMPMASDNSEINTDQPIKFKEEYVVSLSLGSSMPFGTNLKNQFSGGSNFKLDVSTPFEFSGFKFLGHLSMLSIKAEGDRSANYSDYNVTNIGLKVNKKVSFLNLSFGTGLSMSSGTAMYSPYPEYDMTTLYISGGASYTLPLSSILEKVQNEMVQNLSMSLYFGGIEIFGAPSGGDKSQTSDMLNFGLGISYPILF